MVGSVNMYDPYLMAALSSPNINSLSFKGVQQATTPSVDTTTTQTTPVLPQEEFVQNAPAEGSNGAAKKLLAAAGIFMVGAGTYILHKRGPKDKQFFERIWLGAKDVFSSGKDKLIKKPAMITERNGSVIVTVPGKKNIISGKSNYGDKLAEIGEDCFQVKDIKDILRPSTQDGTCNRLKDGYDINSFSFRLFPINGNECTVLYCVDGNKSKMVLKDANGTLKRNAKNKQLFDSAAARIKNIMSGKDDLTKLDRLVVNNTNPKTGLATRVKYSKLSKDGTFSKEALEGEIKSSVSQWFPIEGNTTVNAHRARNPHYDAALKAFQEGKTKDLKILYAKCSAGDLGEFNINGNGNYISLVQGDKTYKAGSEPFDALRQEHKELFEKAAKDKDAWYDPIYKAAA